MKTTNVPELLLYRDSTEEPYIQIGTVTEFTDTLTKNVTATPIVSLTVNDAIAIESGAHLAYHAGFRYHSGQFGMELRDYVHRLISLVDTWQAKTDGYRMKFNVESCETRDGKLTVHPTNPHFPPVFGQNVYVTNLSFRYDAGFTDSITGSISFSVGGLAKVKTSNTDGVYMTDGYSVEWKSTLEEPKVHKQASGPITVFEEYLPVKSDSFYVGITGVSQINGLQRRKVALKCTELRWDYKDRTGWIVDESKSVDLIDSMTFASGPETPFEKVTVKISTRAFEKTYAGWLDNHEIRPGTSVLTVENMDMTESGTSLNTYTVTSFKKNATSMTITAYCNVESCCSSVLSRGYSLSKYAAPYNVIMDILATEGNWGYRDGFMVSNATGTLETYYGNDLLSDSATFQIASGTNIWLALQALAMLANARLFFAGDKAYLIDYSKHNEKYPVQPKDNPWYYDVNLALSYAQGGALPDGTADTIVDSVVGGADTSNNGSASVTNSIVLYCNDGNGSRRGARYRDPKSCNKYSAIVEDTVDWTYVMSSSETDDGRLEAALKQIAKGVCLYRSYAQPEITFTVAEGYDEPYKLDKWGQSGMVNDLWWHRTFPRVASLKGLTDPETGTACTNEVSWPKERAEEPVSDADWVDSASEPRPQILLLSRMVTSYPQMTTEYTFGTVSTVSLAQKTSEIMTRLNSS